MSKWNEKNKSMQHYESQALIYNKQYINEQNAKIEKLITNMKFESNELVLDVGCGTGFIVKYLKDKIEILIGLDFSKRMLKIAQKHKKVFPKLCLIRADADNIPFNAKIFDRIFAITILQNLPTPKKTIKEIKRVAKLDTKIGLTGLKKKFNIKTFIKMIEKENLKILSLYQNKKLKDYLAVCQKLED
jgi:demethylmenaquinone methyltransferase/2-methoxy-6-polyprenyl-1,4-benzoquinol methylase